MMWLETKQVESLTGYRQTNKQQEALRHMGINHTVRPDGTVVVFISDLTCATEQKPVRFTIDD
ncbi:MAG: DUF4224 domain-containing protein [Proteobacteria bacterium]|jgi:hypothetical protein|nr:DUF4224 domain-containing protein [Pseudomonadota bacterium]